MNMRSNKKAAAPDPKAARKARERGERRQAILQAAEAVFIRRGYHLAAIEEIAGEAGFSVGTLYNFFRNKEDLYAHVLHAHHEELTRRFDAVASASADPAQTVAALLALFFDHIGKHQGLARVFFDAEPPARLHMDRAMRRHHTDFIAHYSETLVGLFGRGIASRRFLDLDPQCLSFCFESFLTAFFRYWTSNRMKEPFAVMSARAVQTFMTAIRRQGD